MHSAKDNTDCESVMSLEQKIMAQSDIGGPRCDCIYVKKRSLM